MEHLTEAGRTRLYTRRERRRLTAAVLAAVLGAVAAAVIGAATATWLHGHGIHVPQVNLRPVLPADDQVEATAGGAPQPVGWPIRVSWPASPMWTAAVAVPLWMVWLRLTVRPIVRGLRSETRHRHLASRRAIRHRLSGRAVRRAGHYTLPTTAAWRRWLLPTTTFGYQLGTPLLPPSRRRLWADWEQRIRLIARPGWGKTTRLLIPIVRTLPGAAMVSSTEPAIFHLTIQARQRPAPRLRWRPLDTALARLRPAAPRPVAVLDFSDPARRYAAGYPRVHWNPITDCDDFTIAHRRATALLAGAIPTDTARGDHDRFFRDSAAEVLAAWLHAAALGHRPLDDLLHWLRKPTEPTPTRLLDDHPHADPSALINLRTHLDQRAAKTTSGVERYLTLAMNALATPEGRQLCTPPIDEHTGQPDQFDMAAFIRADGTVYVLSDPARIDRARPLLGLFTAEMFLAAEHLALTQPRQRLQRPFIAVLDEVRHGITVPNLPYVASAQRKYGIGYVYAVQSASQETALYGADAQALRDAAGVTIIGGIDITSAAELTDRAGGTPVVTATRRHDRRDETIHHQPALTVADQQRLADGQAVITARGLGPFLTTIPSIYDRRRTRRRLAREAAEVSRRVGAAQQAERVVRECELAAAEAGADLRATP